MSALWRLGELDDGSPVEQERKRAKTMAVQECELCKAKPEARQQESELRAL